MNISRCSFRCHLILMLAFAMNATLSAGAADRSMFRATTHPKDAEEKNILAVLEDIGRNQRSGNMLVPEDDGRILRLLTEATGAKHVVEIGTSVGYSGIWFGLALRQTGGKLTTFDIDPKRAAQARENF